MYGAMTIITFSIDRGAGASRQAASRQPEQLITNAKQYRASRNAAATSLVQY
jgi:hypothetical protein